MIIVSKYDSKDELSIAVIQPNLNPNEKWDITSRELTLNIMDSLHRNAIDFDSSRVGPQTVQITRNKICFKMN